MTPTYADVNATKMYADMVWQKNPKVSPNSWRVVEGLTVGKCGFSGPVQNAEHLASLFKAGTNLFLVNSETAAGFGAALKQNLENDTIDRRCIVVIAQVGLIYGQTLERWKDYAFSQIARVHDDLWHCMTEDFLNLECNHVQEALGMAPDGFLLQDPEYSLVALQEKDVFYEKLTEALTVFEGRVQNNETQFYGLSSNTLAMNQKDEAAIDLAEIHECTLKAAQNAWGRRKRPAFRMLAAPFNLLETSLVHNTNTTAKTFDGPEEVGTLELAARMNLSVLATRPLHAFIPGQGVLPLRPRNDQPDLVRNAQDKLYDMLKIQLPEKWQKASLPEIALNAAASVAGISCVVDFFQPEDINKNMHIYELGDFADPMKFVENPA